MMKAAWIGVSLLVLISIAKTQAPDRSRPPPLGPPPSLTLPPIQRFKLSNGLHVVMMEKHEVPLVQINLLVKAGAVMDPIEKTGRASMTAAMMTEGAGSRNALQLADAIDVLGATISSVAGQHTLLIALHTPLGKLDSALALFADVALRPTFPVEELERKHKERLTTLLQWRDEPRAIASVLFHRTLYGTRHPYGLPSIGDEQSIRALTVGDLKEFHVACFRPNHAALIVVGDVKASTILSKLESAFSTWHAGNVPSRTWPLVEQVRSRGVYLVDKPGAAQSEVRIGRIGVPRLTDDYYVIVVMNTILGGSFTSRLNQNLREQHGYSYGARSSFDFRPLPGPFVASAAVQTAVTDKALVEFMNELNGILRPVSDEELTRARNYVALGFPDNFQSVAQIASQMAELVVYDLPDDYFNNYIGRILAVTGEDVHRVANKYLDPEKVDIIVVGDLAQIQKGIRELNLGATKVMTIEDVLGNAPIVREGG